MLTTSSESALNAVEYDSHHKIDLLQLVSTVPSRVDVSLSLLQPPSVLSCVLSLDLQLSFIRVPFTLTDVMTCVVCDEWIDVVCSTTKNIVTVPTVILYPSQCLQSFLDAMAFISHHPRS
jgi:hypothetical protein